MTTAAGDPHAWDTLVSRHLARLWHIALSHGLNQHDAADVVQATWLHLLEHIDDVRQPERVGAWLATTARREALRRLDHARRVIPTDDPATLDGHDRLAAPVDEHLLAAEQAAQVRAAVATLPPTWRVLVEALTQDPAPTYAEIVATLGVPIGSIGPTRARCVDRLRPLVDG